MVQKVNAKVALKWLKPEDFVPADSKMKVSPSHVDIIALIIT